ncbi:MAG: sulfite exporter TauE/SafE family protein [Alphaproteobacteria bacterium]|nr:sulfite exporter TauE/SafE family protein [Alphaproteobacteria bacterium]
MIDIFLAHPLSWVLVPFSVLMVGISKSGFGGGFGFLATPVLAVFVSPRDAVAISLPILLLMDIVAMYSWRKTWVEVWKKGLAGFRAIMLGAALGVGLGTFTFALWDKQTLLVALGGMCILFVGWQAAMAYRQHRASLQPSPPATPRKKSGSRARLGALGLLTGTAAGFTSTLAHAGGPIVAMYLLAYRESDGSHMPRGQFVASSVLFFFFVNALKVPSYTALDLFSQESWIVTAVLVPVAIIGARLGLFLHGRFPVRIFYAICYSTLTIIGCWLIVQALYGSGTSG